MKKILSKKMVLPLVAGVLTTVIALAGTFAWFTSSAAATKGDFKAAKVQLDHTVGTNNIWNFYPGDPTTIAAQIELEAAVNLPTQAEVDDAFIAWWNAYRGDNFSRWAFADETTGDITPPVPGKVNFLVAPTSTDEVLGADRNFTDLVTPGCFIYRYNNFVNTSNVPVYFRVEKPVISGGGALPYAAYLNVEDKGIECALLTDGGDGYLYFLEPLEAGANVKIMLNAYLRGATGNDFQEQTITFGSKGAELIQATNNAVYLSGWGAPENLVFKPYTEK